MASTDIAVQTINSLLDPRLSQVIGSTPESLQDAVVRSVFENDSAMGAKFIALSVFSASVKKSVAEEFFISKDLEDLRVKITNAFVLKGKLNMTAMTLAGHCFTLVPSLSGVKYIVEFKKKIGGENIWDADLSKGSASEEMKKIMMQKVRLHPKDKCLNFATWFISYTGIGKGKAPVRTRQQAFIPPQVPPSGTATGPGSSTIDITAQVPDELVEEWIDVTGRSEEDLAANITKNGLDRTIRAMKREIAKARGVDSGTVFDSRSAAGETSV